jgi:hypothetical protein
MHCYEMIVNYFNFSQWYFTSYLCTYLPTLPICPHTTGNKTIIHIILTNKALSRYHNMIVVIILLKCNPLLLPIVCSV